MTGVELIVKERARQVEEEGYTVDHDTRHAKGELAWAAMYYAMPCNASLNNGDTSVDKGVLHPLFFFSQTGWGIERAKRNRKERIQQLVVAGALIAAEIDRLQRKATGD